MWNLYLLFWPLHLTMLSVPQPRRTLAASSTGHTLQAPSHSSKEPSGFYRICSLWVFKLLSELYCKVRVMEGFFQSAMEIVNVLERSHPHKAFSSAVGHWCKQNSGCCCQNLALPDNYVVPEGKGVGSFGSGVVWRVICVYKNKTSTAGKYKTSTVVTRVVFSSTALC